MKQQIKKKLLLLYFLFLLMFSLIAFEFIWMGIWSWKTYNLVIVVIPNQTVEFPLATLSLIPLAFSSSALIGGVAIASWFAMNDARIRYWRIIKNQNNKTGDEQEIYLE